LGSRAVPLRILCFAKQGVLLCAAGALRVSRAAATADVQPNKSWQEEEIGGLPRICVPRLRRHPIRRAVEARGRTAKSVNASARQAVGEGDRGQRRHFSDAAIN
jgi:hypothetical protein